MTITRHGVVMYMSGEAHLGAPMFAMQESRNAVALPRRNPAVWLCRPTSERSTWCGCPMVRLSHSAVLLWDVIATAGCRGTVHSGVDHQCMAYMYFTYDASMLVSIHIANGSIVGRR